MIIRYPLATEKSVRLIDAENKIIFVVDNKATKREIKEALETQLNAKVEKINVLNDQDGKKRAYVRFAAETPAIDVATDLGLM